MDLIEMADPTDFADLAARCRRAQRVLGRVAGERRSQLLETLDAVLAARGDEVLAANERDLVIAARTELADPLLRRLALDQGKLATLRAGVLQLARSDDPVGREILATELDSGLRLSKVRSPVGVLLIIFESRPDAVIQIGSLALRSGNAVILKGGSEAAESNRVLVGCLRESLERCGLDPNAVTGIEGRAAVGELLKLDQQIDLVIPRGSGELVTSIQNSTRIPVLGHAEGVCHLYLHEKADPDMATHLAIDGVCGYPAACNATETILVDRGFLPHLTEVGKALFSRGVELRADSESATRMPFAVAAAASDFGHEFGDLTVAVKTVGGLDEAIEHIHEFGSAHTDAIVTADIDIGERFLAAVDSASVFVNASTRFADGYRYGLGAEVGISTGRIHARGPVGVDGLLTERWLLRGSGQAAGDFGPGKREFLHRRLEVAT